MSGILATQLVFPFSKWRNHILTSQKDETKIIGDIMRLHNKSMPFHLDPCYSIGRFWRGLPEPLLKFDVSPKREGCVKSSADHLPLPDGSVGSIMFDPPFIIRDKPSENGIISKRFSFFTSIGSLWGFYRDCISEFHRVLTKNGLLVIKCQDTIYWHRQYMSHFEIMKYLEEMGYRFEDLFILTRDNVMFSPNMEKQAHARKNHCYYIVARRLK